MQLGHKRDIVITGVLLFGGGLTAWQLEYMYSARAETEHHYIFFFRLWYSMGEIEVL